MIFDSDFLRIYEQLDKLTEESNKNTDTLDIESLDLAIQKHFGSDIPGEQCIYIAANGKFINLYPELTEHEELATWLVGQSLIKLPVGKTASSYLDELAEDYTENFFADFLRYIQCRNHEDLCYVVLPENRPTFDQYEKLEQWLNDRVFTNKKCSQIEITCLDRDIKSYKKDYYSAEDLIKLIKRCYASGRLYEELKSKKNLQESTTGYLVDIDGNKLEATSYRTFDEIDCPDYTPGFKKLGNHMFEVHGAPIDLQPNLFSFEATYAVGQKDYRIYIEPVEPDKRGRNYVENWGYELIDLGDHITSWGGFSRQNRGGELIAGNLLYGGKRWAAEKIKDYDELLETLLKLGVIADKSKCI